MKRVKFPRTRRDRFKDRRRKPSYFPEGDGESKKANIYNPRKLRFSTINSQPEQTGKYTLDKYLGYAAAYHPQVFPRTEAPGDLPSEQPMFPAESQMPLATNAESWGNLAVGMSTPRNLSRNMTEGSDHGSLPSLSASQTGGLENTTMVLPGRRPERFDDEDDDDDVFVNSPMDRWREEQGSSFPSMDTVDQGSQKGGATGVDMFFSCLGIFTYVLDVMTDLLLVYQYFSLGHYYWFGLTLGFFFLPSVIMSIFSLVLYLRDWRIVGEKVSPLRWTLRGVFLAFLLSPLIRVLESTYYAHKSRSEKDVLKRREYYDRWLDEDTDFMLLRLFEAFLEAAPQLVLQLYILCQLGTSDGAGIVALQVIGILSSWLAITTTIVTFNKSLRLSQPKKAKLKMRGLATMFFWRLFTIASRVVALALFASIFQAAIFGVVGGHFLLMLIWVVMQETDYCMLIDGSGKKHNSPVLEFLFRIVTAFVNIFCFFNLIEGHSRLRCTVFYVVVYIENAAMVLTWYFVVSKQSTTTWYFIPALLIVLLGFWLGIFFQILYYKWFHPNDISVLHVRKRIRWCVPCTDLFMCKETAEGHETGAASERVLNNKSENPLQTSTPAPSMYTYQSPHKQHPNHPIETSTPAPSLYSYNSPERPIQMVQPQPFRSQPVQPQPFQTKPRQPQPFQTQPTSQPSVSRQPSSASYNNNRPSQPSVSRQPSSASYNNNRPVVRRMPVQTAKPTPSPIHGPYHTPHASKPATTKPFSPPHRQPPSPIKTLVSAPPRMEPEESTEEPLPQSARASLPRELPINIPSAPRGTRLSSGGQTTTSDDITMSSSEDLIAQPTAKVVNPALKSGRIPGVVPIKRASTLPTGKPPPSRDLPRSSSYSRAQVSSQDESSSGSCTESDTDEEEFSPRPLIARSHSVTFGPPPEGPTGRTDEVIANPTKKRPRPSTPRDMSGGRPRSPRDLSRGRPRSPRDLSWERPRSPRQPSGSRPRSPRDMSSGRPRSPKDMSQGRPSSPRDMSSGRPISPRDMSSGRPRSPRDMSSGRPRSPRDMSSGRPSSPRDMSSGRPRSPRDMSSGRPSSPRDMSSGRPRSPRDMSSGRPRSPRDMSSGRPSSPRDMSSGRPSSPRDVSEGRPKSPREMSARSRSPREFSGAPYPRVPMHDASVFRPVAQRAPVAPPAAQNVFVYPPPTKLPQAPHQGNVPPKQPRQRTPRHREPVHAPAYGRPDATSGSRPLQSRQPVQKGPPRNRPSPSKHHTPGGGGHQPPHAPRVPPQAYTSNRGVPVRGTQEYKSSPGDQGNETTV